MDDAGSDKAVIWGSSEGGPVSILFAATYPERVEGLVLYGTYAFPRNEEGHPIGRTPAEQEEFTELLTNGWGDGAGLELFAPSIADDPGALAMSARRQRVSASPSGVRGLLEVSFAIDVRDALALIQAPTLVIHLTGDQVVSVELGREVADGIDNAELIERPGTDHLFGPDDMGDLILEFVTGESPTIDANRSLATVLFTDVVSSTEQVQSVGDQRWAETLDALDQLIDRQVARSGGSVVKSTGDGALALFDGPTRAIRAAMAISDGATGIGISVRTGLHTGEIVRRGRDVAGLAVHIAARVAGVAGPGEILVSRMTADLVAGSGLEFSARGEHPLKGVEGKWTLLAPLT
jgi:class 3 adenylate cyclase